MIPPANCPSVDQRGNPRPGTGVADTMCDAGAFEAQNGE